MVPMREVMRRAGDSKADLARIQEEVCEKKILVYLTIFTYFLGQGFQLRPLVLEDFFQTDGTSALPTQQEITLEAVLEKLVG